MIFLFCVSGSIREVRYYAFLAFDAISAFFAESCRARSSVMACAIPRRSVRPARTSRVRLPAPPNRNTRSASRLSLICFCISATSCFVISAIELLTRNDANGQRKFRPRLAERFACDGLDGAVNLENNASRLHIENVACYIALTATHAYFCGFAGEWSVRENARPNFCALAACTRKCATGSLYLIGGDACLRERLQT